MSDDRVDTNEIDCYVKLFLLSCKQLDECARDNIMKKTDEISERNIAAAAKKNRATTKKPKNRATTTTSKAQKRKDKNDTSGPFGVIKKKKKNNNNKATTITDKAQKQNAKSDSSGSSNASKKKHIPFHASASNYSSLTNFPAQIDLLPRGREATWEGVDKGYIKYIKREMSGMRHTPKFFGTILSKLLKMFFIDQVNANNSFHKIREYSRTCNLKCLKGSDDMGKVFDNNNVLSSIIGNDNEIYRCKKVLANEGGGFNLFKLQFDDDNGGTVNELHYAPVRLGYESDPIHVLDHKLLETFTRQHIVMKNHY